MDVRAIVLLGAVAENSSEHISGVPIALLDVLGRSVLHRVTSQMRNGGFSRIRVIGDFGPQSSRILRRALPPEYELETATGDSLWRAAQHTFSQFAQDGADHVVIRRLGAYAEFDFEQLSQFHLNQNGRVTAVTDSEGELLGTFIVSASRRNDATYLLRHRLTSSRVPFVPFAFSGYVNRLSSAADLRRLAVDAFCGRAQILPEGNEIKPGVWVGDGARIHRGARVLAPAFIGERTRIRASAVVTRCSTVEHHAEVDCGTVVEDASILPYTTLGAGLDVAHSVVGFRRILHLRRMAEVEVFDPKLVGMAAAAPVRVLNRAAALAGFIPVNFLRGLFGRADNDPSLRDAVRSPSAALNAPDSLTATDPALSNYR